MTIRQSKLEGPRTRGAARAGFTMVEIMISVLILSLLIGLLIGGVRMVTATTKSTVDRQTVNAIKVGGVQFKQLFGFYMPLVRERAVDPIPGQHTYITVGTGPTRRNKVCVYQPSDPDFIQELQGEELPALQSANPNNPFIDYRFSERSIPIYLVGQLSVPLIPTQANGVPIDGLAGPGFYKPLADGTFAVSNDLINPVAGAAGSKRTGASYEPLITVNSNAPKLYEDPSATNHDVVEVRDRNGVAIRYYRWEHGGPPQANGSMSFNVPRMVGRNAGDIPGFNPPADRETSRNSNIRGASFAIVAAGPNGVFGDEPLDVICQKLGVAYDTANEIKIRMQAEQDNIVEVGP